MDSDVVYPGNPARPSVRLGPPYAWSGRQNSSEDRRAGGLRFWLSNQRMFPLGWMLELWVGSILATLVAGWIYLDI